MNAAEQEEVLPQVIVTGAPEILQENILATIRITDESCSNSIQGLQSLESEMQDDIQASSRALGYYHVTAEVTFSIDEDCWQLGLEVDPGPRVTLQSVNISLSDDVRRLEAFVQAQDDNPLNAGDFLNHSNYESLKSALSAAAVEQGYFSARFTQSEIAINTETNTASISLVFEEGPRYRLGRIDIENNTPLNETFIRRLIVVSEGEGYSGSALLAIRENLDNSQYFSAISVIPNASANASNEVPLLIALEPRPRHAYSAGLSFTTDTGPRLSLDYDKRYVNSRGHRLETELDLSEVRDSFNSSYQIPLQDPSRQLYEIRFGVLQENNDSFESERFTLENNYRHELENGWLASLFVNYQRDDYTVNLQSDRSRLTMIGMSLAKTRADNLIFPTKGWHLFGQVRGASNSLLSDTSLIQTELTARFIKSVSENNRVLLRLNTAMTWIDDKSELPASLRFFAGGDQSLRGYDYQSIGPVDAMDQVIGGKHLVTGSVEYDFRIKGKWRGAVFYDGGNAFSDFKKIEWKHSVGFGARWLSPIGPVRVDLGFPLEDGGVRLHISMGPDL